jgi:hypothetical protein
VAGESLKTPRASSLPTLLVVGGSAGFVERCRRLASNHRVFVKDSDVASAPTSATRARPRVILVAHEIYVRDPLELDALARDVQATLVRIADESVDDDELEGAIAEAGARRPRQPLS